VSHSTVIGCRESWFSLGGLASLTAIDERYSDLEEKDACQYE